MVQQYTRTAILLHWVIAVLLICQFAFGWYLDGIPRGVPERSYFVNLHKSTGILIGLLILVRLGWRLTHKPPPLPDSISHFQQRIASATHILLYVLMIVMPLSGYVASNFSKWGVKFFNVITLPPWGFEDEFIYAVFNQTHKVTSWLLLGLVILHVLAGLKHLFIDRDRIFSRILPRCFPER
ncbi:cytochrome b [Pollutimonas bauzanensis]|uniref:cytochrome b n=1 Tax=Pollutimonas bauzanensis TaxID=658167 RepID=UPI00333E4907